MAIKTVKTGKLYACDKCPVVWSRRTGRSKMMNKEPDYNYNFPRRQTILTCPKCLGVDVTKDKWWVNYGS